jgi:hypothetical protein
MVPRGLLIPAIWLTTTEVIGFYRVALLLKVFCAGPIIAGGWLYILASGPFCSDSRDGLQFLHLDVTGSASVLPIDRET